VEEIIGRGPTAPTGNIPFTPRAKKVLELSLREALQLGHNYIGPEHILLGVIREGKGVAAQVLVRLGAGLESVRQKVTELLAQAAAVSSGEKFEAFGPGTRRSFVPLSDLPFDHRAVLAVELAQAAARRRGQRTINPLDLLMGLLRARDEEVAGMLQALGADWVKIRRALEDELGTEGEDTPEPDA
jgi:ATP-dependent Clp protease ATP-binding subunit ClpA